MHLAQLAAGAHSASPLAGFLLTHAACLARLPAPSHCRPPLLGRSIQRRLMHVLLLGLPAWLAARAAGPIIWAVVVWHGWPAVLDRPWKLLLRQVLRQLGRQLPLVRAVLQELPEPGVLLLMPLHLGPEGAQRQGAGRLLMPSWGLQH